MLTHQQTPTVSLQFNCLFLSEPGLTGFIRAKDDGSGGDNWSYKMSKAPVKSSPPTNQHPVFYRVAPDLIFSNPARAGFVISNTAGAGAGFPDNPSVSAVSLCELGSIFVISHC